MIIYKNIFSIFLFLKLVLIKIKVKSLFYKNKIEFLTPNGFGCCSMFGFRILKNPTRIFSSLGSPTSNSNSNRARLLASLSEIEIINGGSEFSQQREDRSGIPTSFSSVWSCFYAFRVVMVLGYTLVWFRCVCCELYLLDNLDCSIEDFFWGFHGFW